MKKGNIKNERVELRVKEKDKELLRLFDIKFSYVWELGMEHIYKNIPKYAQKMYVQKHEIKANVRTINDIFNNRESNLNDLCEEYLQNRDINKPSRQDLNWIEGRVTSIDGLTSEGFMTYCKLYDSNKKKEKL